MKRGRKNRCNCFVQHLQESSLLTASNCTASCHHCLKSLQPGVPVVQEPGQMPWRCVNTSWVHQRFQVAVCAYSTLLGLPRRAAKECSINPVTCCSEKEFAMLAGMVSPLLCQKDRLFWQGAAHRGSTPPHARSSYGRAAAWVAFGLHPPDGDHRICAFTGEPGATP